jgi:hypothetical protein
VALDPTRETGRPPRRTRFAVFAVALALLVGGTALAETSRPAGSHRPRPVAAVADDPAGWIDSFEAAPAYEGAAPQPAADGGGDQGLVPATPEPSGSGGMPQSGTS